jgi:CRP/FNR family transcriptional regulator/CRP/FNR family cyclic AMP-dependent transcriptional regulator
MSALPLFSGLSASDVEKLHDMLRVEDVPDGTLVVSQERPTSDACIVLSGMLKVYLDRPDGSEIVFALLGPGEVVGELNLIDHLGRSANVITLEDTGLLWLDEQSFRDCLKSMPRLAHNLLTILARRLRLANAQVQALAHLAIQGRIAHQLLALADSYGTADDAGNVHIHPKLTDADLAGMVGAGEDQVHRVLSMFHRNSYLSIDAERHVTVHDTEALARICS